jgi:hypothetical protein
MGMRDPSQWEPSDSAPPSPAGASPRRAGRPVAAEWLVPVAAALFFVDTFLSWQRACVGIVSIALAVWVVLRLLQAGPAPRPALDRSSACSRGSSSAPAR